MGDPVTIFAGITAVSGLIGAGATAYGAMNQPDVPKIEAPPELPELPDPTVEKRKKLGRGSTLLTRPSGLGSPVTSYKPTLLGQ